MVIGDFDKFLSNVPENLKEIATSLTHDIAMNCDVAVSGVDVTLESGDVKHFEALLVTTKAHPDAKLTVLIDGDDVCIVLDIEGQDPRAVRRPFAETPAQEVTQFVRSVFKGASN